jgi:hypothetical protein
MIKYVVIPEKEEVWPTPPYIPDVDSDTTFSSIGGEGIFFLNEFIKNIETGEIYRIEQYDKNRKLFQILYVDDTDGYIEVSIDEIVKEYANYNPPDSKLNYPINYPVNQTYQDPERPTFVRILNKRYSIEYVDKLQEQDLGRFGLCDTNNQRILIADQNSSEQIADTFLHEVIHAYTWEMKVLDSENLKESIASRLATGLCQFWQDNPEATRWWQGLNNITL